MGELAADVTANTGDTDLGPCALCPRMLGNLAYASEREQAADAITELADRLSSSDDPRVIDLVLWAWEVAGLSRDAAAGIREQSAESKKGCHGATVVRRFVGGEYVGTGLVCGKKPNGPTPPA